MTEYVILKADDNNELTWFDYGTPVEASSPRRALALAKVEAGAYVAIPARSWKPLTVKTEQTVKVTIS